MTKTGKNYVELNYYRCPYSVPITDTLHRKSRDPWATSDASKMHATSCRAGLSPAQRIEQMERFLDDYYNDEEIIAPTMDKAARYSEITVEMEMDGTYEHTMDELTWAAKTAWRNASRCVGRNLWKSLTVYDGRHAKTGTAISEAVWSYLRLAFNNGEIRSSAIVFPQRSPGDQATPGIRIWNGVLLSYAGHPKPNGEIIGDPKNAFLTKIATQYGWVSKGGPFELLPLIITDAHQKTDIYELPDDIKNYVVKIFDPDYPELREASLEWYAIPSVSNMMLEAGGVQYTCAPISGFFQDTEVSVMDLLGEQRYNLLAPIGRLLGLDTSSNTTYWKSEAATLFTRIVYNSYKRAGVTMVDHFTLADNFVDFMHKETAVRGGCPADWVWIVPALSSGLVPTFHQEMLRYVLSPSYEYQDPAESYFETPGRKTSFKNAAWSIVFIIRISRSIRKKRNNVTILYGTESGTSYSFATYAEDLLRDRFNVSVLPMKAVEDAQNSIRSTSLTIIITSTFGSGEPPAMAVEFADDLKNNNYSYENVKFAVFGLGSTNYPNFAQFSKFIRERFNKFGAREVVEIRFGDDQADQMKAFDKWINSVMSWCFTDLICTQQNSSWSMKQKSEKFYRWQYELDESAICNEHCKKVLPSQSLQKFTIKNRKLWPSENPKYYLIELGFGTPENGDRVNPAPGDHLRILPQNHDDDVVGVKKMLLDKPWDNISVKLEERLGSESYWTDIRDIPAGYTLDVYLKHFVNLNAHFTDLRPKDCAEFIGQGLTNGEVNIKSGGMNYRTYSIASWSDKPTSINLLVSRHMFEDGDGERREGICSRFLREHPIGGVVYGYFAGSGKTSVHTMKLPEDPSLPIICVSAGSGFAPFLSFIDKRAEEKRRGVKVGKMYVFHGCWDMDHNFLERLVNKRKLGINIKTFTAYSRAPRQKMYVQHLVKKKIKLVQRILDHGGYVYVCGAGEMVNGVKDILSLKVDTDINVKELLENGRYQEEQYS